MRELAASGAGNRSELFCFPDQVGYKPWFDHDFLGQSPGERMATGVSCAGQRSGQRSPARLPLSLTRNLALRTSTIPSELVWRELVGAWRKRDDPVFGGRDRQLKSFEVAQKFPTRINVGIFTHAAA